MGYDVHITRKTNWFDDEPQIDIDEWRTLVASDKEMRLEDTPKPRSAAEQSFAWKAKG
ncbi:hypothetical protein [Burkholderia ubonensis]|uniref:hypothetical protein n=1 Tax=Burkholderia ubonensis TaxID=101571 RepID=UPI000A9B6A88|nr:hypothetical protein [Burkholderia ubonensis]